MSVLAAAVTLPFILSSCLISYSDFPAQFAEPVKPVRSYDLLSYEVAPFPFPDEGGQEALHSVFRNLTPFANTVAVQGIPGNGVFCRVDVQWNEPGLGPTIFRYLSLITLTALPSWSREESYVVNYRIFVDGQERKTFTYKINRSTAVWVGLILVSWMNFFTPTQAEAFESTALQFLDDAKPIFATLRPQEHIVN